MNLIPRRTRMSATRREMFLLLSGLVSSAVALEALPSQDNSLPSTTFPFSELPKKVVNGAEIRPGSERQTGHSRVAGSPRNHITPGWDAACRASPHAQRNVAHSGRYCTAHDQWHQPCYGPGFGWIRSFQRRARHQISARLRPLILSWRSDRGRMHQRRRVGIAS